MRVLVSGASGLIGSALCDAFAQRGDSVTKLVRKEETPSGNEIRWDPAAAQLEPEKLEGFDAAIHLSGESIASGRWTERKKREIIQSRTRTTKLLARTFRELGAPPKTWVVASATGFYGHCGDRWLDEEQPCGETFLAEVSRQWEEASYPARDAGIRVLNARFGLVMSRQKSPFTRMLLPFKLGLGGPVGPGTQYLGWITRHDAIRALMHGIAAPPLQGPVNVVSPHPVRNKELATALGRALGRPALLPFPAFAARMLFGEMADELLLASQRATPRKLLESGFTFDYPELDQALRLILEAR